MPLCSSVGGHFVARFLHFCCRWRENWAKRRGFARSGALGLPSAGHGLAGGFCATLNTYKHALCRYNADKFAKYRLRGYTFLLYIWDIERLQVDSSASP